MSNDFLSVALIICNLIFMKTYSLKKRVMKIRWTIVEIINSSNGSGSDSAALYEHHKRYWTTANSCRSLAELFTLQCKSITNPFMASSRRSILLCCLDVFELATYWKKLYCWNYVVWVTLWREVDPLNILRVPGSNFKVFTDLEFVSSCSLFFSISCSFSFWITSFNTENNSSLLSCLKNCFFIYYSGRRLYQCNENEFTSKQREAVNLLSFGLFRYLNM